MPAPTATLTVQSDAGTVANANGYITVAQFKAYHLDRGTYAGADSDAVIGTAIVRATDHIDTSKTYKGTLLEDDQTTQFPREGLYVNSVLIEGIPVGVEKACAEYALRALAAPLIPDSDDPTSGVIKRVRSKVDVIEDETEYMDGAGPGSQLPAYPAADLLLKPYLSSGSTGGRLIR